MALPSKIPKIPEDTSYGQQAGRRESDRLECYNLFIQQIWLNSIEININFWGQFKLTTATAKAS